MSVYVYKKDLPNDVLMHITKKCFTVAIDTETTGLNPIIDRLCLVQIGTTDNVFIIKIEDEKPDNLKKLLENNNIEKIFHNANFDLRFLSYTLGTKNIRNVVCTKIAYKLLYGLENGSSLKLLVKKYFNKLLDKTMQVSDWSIGNLSDEQLSYAATDVIYLIPLWEKLKKELEDRSLVDYAQACFTYLPVQILLENQGIKNIFEY